MTVNLSDQQSRILSLISHGYNNFDIAAELYVDINTVKTHISRMLRTLRASDRAHAVRIGFEDGLLVPAVHRRPRVPKPTRVSGGVS